MALVDVRGFDLTPSFGRGLAGGIQTAQQFQQLGQRNLAAEREAQVRQALSGAINPQTAPQTQQQQMLAEQSVGLPGAIALEEQPAPAMSQEERIRTAQGIDPAIANKLLEDAGLDSASKRAEASRFAADLELTPPEMRSQKIQERAVRLRAEGRDPTQTMELLDMDTETQNQALLSAQLLDLSTKERFAVKERTARAEQQLSKSAQVKSSDILPDGTTIQVMGDGKTRVTAPDGALLAGKERADAIKTAQEFGVDIQQRRSQARGVGKFTAKKAEIVTDRAEKLRENNSNLRQVIAEVEAGAETGALIDKLPSFRASSVRLENLKRQLGLDVIGSVTFGALSEAELKMALDTALPTKLDGPELVKWANDKISAQEKLAAYLEEQSSHLIQPGNTPDTWRQEIERRKQAAETTEAATIEATQQILRFNPATGRLE